MGIIRGGDAEYDEFAPSYKEKAEKLEETLKLMLGQNSKSIKLSGKYIATDEIKIIGNFLHHSLDGWLYTLDCNSELHQSKRRNNSYQYKNSTQSY